MVRFEPKKLVIEIASENPYYLYLQLLHALFVIGHTATEQSVEQATPQAFGVLSFEIGKSLAEMDSQTKQQIEDLLTK